MRSAWVCSRNDVIGNTAVLAALLGGRDEVGMADILIGLMIAGVFGRSRSRLSARRRARSVLSA
jgi:hypothetical protein